MTFIDVTSGSLPVETTGVKEFLAKSVGMLQGAGDDFTGDFFWGGLPVKNAKTVVGFLFDINPADLVGPVPSEEYNARGEYTAKVWAGAARNTTVADAALQHVLGPNLQNARGMKALAVRVNERRFALFITLNKSLKQLEAKGLQVESDPTWPFVNCDKTQWGFPGEAVAVDYEELYAFVATNYGVVAARPDLFVWSALKEAVAASACADQYAAMTNAALPKVPSVGRRKFTPGQKLNAFQQYLQENNLTVEDVE